jgi:hypothetical protein
MKKVIDLPLPLYLYKFALNEYALTGIADFSKTTIMSICTYKYFDKYFEGVTQNPKDYHNLRILSQQSNKKYLYALKCYLEDVFHTKFTLYVEAHLSTGKLLKEILPSFLQKYNICEFTELKLDTLQKRWTRHRAKYKVSTNLLAA